MALLEERESRGGGGVTAPKGHTGAKRSVQKYSGLAKEDRELQERFDKLREKTAEESKVFRTFERNFFRQISANCRKIRVSRNVEKALWHPSFSKPDIYFSYVSLHLNYQSHTCVLRV